MTTRLRVLVTLIALLCAPVCHATLLTYSTSNIAGTAWRYDYSITNDTLSAPIFEFTIFFDQSLYANLAVAASPPEWDSIVIQPDLNLPDDGFFDALALSSGVTPGTTVSSFSVFFDWLSVGTPGSQVFDVLDPIDFALLDSGVTSLLMEPPPATTVPEPTTLLLFGLGALGLTIRRGRFV